MELYNTEELTVSIKVLKVNSKKMTQTVYKQLPEKSIVDDNMELIGTVWGQVNYHTPGQRKCLTNIVWQQGEKLYRCAIKGLHYSAENIKNKSNDCEFNPYREFPHSALASAVGKLSIAEAQELFDKYRVLYSDLINSEQLFIGT